MPNIRRVLAAQLLALALLAASAHAHGGTDQQHRARIVSIEPRSVPVEVRVTASGELRFSNRGEQPLILCGNEQARCDEWVTMNEDGVFVDTNTAAYHLNVVDGEGRGLPADVGAGGPTRKLIRRSPLYFSYHDHRASRAAAAQIPFRYGAARGVVRLQADYLDRRSTIARWTEPVLIGCGVVALLAAFAFDGRRRRRRRRDEPTDAG